MINQTVNIKKYNEANLVLRHFIQRSARLLPIFAELKTLKLKDSESRRQFEAIAEMFKHFNYDDETSRHLMNSDILERVRTTFWAIYNAEELSSKSSDALLSHFFSEYQSLLHNWNLVELN